MGITWSQVAFGCGSFALQWKPLVGFPVSLTYIGRCALMAVILGCQISAADHYLHRGRSWPLSEGHQTKVCPFLSKSSGPMPNLSSSGSQLEGGRTISVRGVFASRILYDPGSAIDAPPFRVFGRARCPRFRLCRGASGFGLQGSSSASFSTLE